MPEARRETIAALLERWDELEWPGAAGDGGLGGDAIRLLPHSKRCRIWLGKPCSCHLASLVELERCLGLLAAEDVVAYRHLRARFGLVERIRRRNVRFRRGRWEGLEPNETVLIPRFERGQRGTAERVYDDVLVARWPAWVRLNHAERGVDQLVEWFRGEPTLPDEAIAA